MIEQLELKSDFPAHKGWHFAFKNLTSYQMNINHRLTQIITDLEAVHKLPSFIERSRDDILIKTDYQCYIHFDSAQ